MRYSGDCNGIYKLRKRGSEKKRTRRREDEDKIKCGEHRSGERHFSGAGKWKAALVPAYSGIHGTESRNVRSMFPGRVSIYVFIYDSFAK